MNMSLIDDMYSLGLIDPIRSNPYLKLSPLEILVLEDLIKLLKERNIICKITSKTTIRPLGQGDEVKFTYSFKVQGHKTPFKVYSLSGGYAPYKELRTMLRELL